MNAHFGGTWERLEDGRFLEAGSSITNKDAGLPNLKGSITGACYSGSPVDGVFQTTQTGNCTLGTSGGSVVKYNYFNAHTYSSIYKDEVKTVQPKSRVVYIYKRIS